MSVFAFGRPGEGFRYDQDEGVMLSKVSAIGSTFCNGKEVFIPNIKPANRVIADKPSFQRRIVDRVAINYGLDADGVCLSHREAVIMATGDCPILVFTIPGISKAVVVHAGRLSLIGESPDKLIGAKSSVVTRALTFFKKEERGRVFAYVIAGIDKKSFLHNPRDSVWGPRNKKLLSHVKSLYGEGSVDMTSGALSLHEIIRTQCIQAGLLGESVRFDGVDTYTDRLPNGEYAWWSNRRGDRNRNIIIVSV